MNYNRNAAVSALPPATMLTFLVMFFTIVVLSGCDHTATQHPRFFSANQKYLSDLLYDYKTAYMASPNDSTTQFIMDWYQAKLNHFLIDSLGRSVDSIRVTIDEVTEDNRVVTTRFHFQEIEFKYSMRFIEDLDEKGNTWYQWMRNLQPGNDVTVRFTFIGESILNPADVTPGPIIRIFAYPAPIKLADNSSTHT